MKDDDIKVFLGEQDEVQRCNVMFRVASESVNPNLLTRQLGLQPTHAWAKGDHHVGKSGRDLRRPMGHWSVSTEDFVSKSLEAHCRRLISVLEQHKPAIRQIRDSHAYRTSIDIWWQVGEIGHGSFNLLSETMAQLAKYCDDFAFHFL